MIPIGKFSCPSCGSPGQHFSAIQSLNRVAKRKCDSCGIEIESDVGNWKYILLLIYIQVIVTLVALPLVLAIVTERWGIAIAFAAVFVVFVWPPAMMLHARNAIVRDRDERGYERGVWKRVWRVWKRVWKPQGGS